MSKEKLEYFRMRVDNLNKSIRHHKLVAELEQEKVDTLVNQRDSYLWAISQLEKEEKNG